MSEPVVAALFVQRNGVYWDDPRIDPWDEARDARLYDGPLPVIAHPPCKTWSLMGNCRPELRQQGDGGTFQAALEAVEKYGGILEHPAHTRAWRTFNLPKPARHGWNIALYGRPGWATEVDQRAYGHKLPKPTWLYYVGDAPPPALLWDNGPPAELTPAGHKRSVRNSHRGNGDLRSATPPSFREALISIALSARSEKATPQEQEQVGRSGL